MQAFGVSGAPGKAEKDEDDDDDEQDPLSKANEVVAQSLKFAEAHLFSNELIKIGALVFDDSTETVQDQLQAEGEEGQEERQEDEAVDDRGTRKMRFKVYEIKNDVSELSRGTSAVEPHHKLKMKVIVFACKTKEQRDSLLK